ncbi:MAG: DUF1501 domain-containing protein [Verrucomicrobiaceae bacterium]|nr:DUF1501 domain-containing protein [Verrucomicrobiaceae bacterium]
MSAPLTRREILSRSGLGLGVLGLGLAHSAATTTRPHRPAKARRIIHFFLNGGPSHVDTFDPKPALLKHEGKPVPNHRLTERKTGAAFPSPFKFQRYGQSGIEVSELFAKTATHIDDIAVIRSMYAQVPNHEPSLMLMNCGDSIQPRPSLGAWLTYGLGSDNRNLPDFISMCPGGLPIKGTENWQAAFLPGAFQGTYIDSKQSSVDQLIENIRSPHATLEVQRRQLDFLLRINNAHKQSRHDPRLEARIDSFELAFRMQTEAADAFDVTREPKHIRELYGDTIHGRQTLIARRLIERGVRMVQLWHGAGQPWDNHDNIETKHRQLAAEIDQPIAALLHDLKQRGLLDETIVLWGGEFGRTPTVELAGGQSKLGRDHNHYGFTVWMAGGGIKGGTTYGATDELGFAAEKHAVSIHDLHATILHLMGLDHEQLTYRHGGRDFRLTDVYGEVIRPILA